MRTIRSDAMTTAGPYYASRAADAIEQRLADKITRLFQQKPAAARIMEDLIDEALTRGLPQAESYTR
jgi:hypothetical protein